MAKLKELLHLGEWEELRSNYRIKETIYTSENAIVYQAYDNKRQKKCVVKEYFPNKLATRCNDGKTVSCKIQSLTGAYYAALEIFMNEGRVLKLFEHMNIARYVDHFVENNTGYIVTDNYEGLTLYELKREGIRFHLSYYLKHIYIPIINTVIWMHKCGIMARDIKPAGIILCERDVPVFIDLSSAVNTRDEGYGDDGRTRKEMLLEDRLSDMKGLSRLLYFFLYGKDPSYVDYNSYIEDMKADANKNNNISKWFSRILAKNLYAGNKKGYASPRLYKLFVYLEYILLYLRNRLNDDKNR